MKRLRRVRCFSRKGWSSGSLDVVIFPYLWPTGCARIMAPLATIGHPEGAPPMPVTDRIPPAHRPLAVDVPARLAAIDQKKLRAWRLERLRAELRKRDYAGALFGDPLNIRNATGS